jgi:multiple sugar transport system permease protein
MTTKCVYLLTTLHDIKRDELKNASVSIQTRLSSVGLRLVAPAWCLLILTYVVPVCMLFALSFTDYEMGSLDIRWISIQNFSHLFSDAVFKRSLMNTLLYIFILVPSSVFFGLLAALLVQSNKKTRSIYEVIYFLPVTTTLIAMATVWQFLLHPKLGPVTNFIALLGLNPPNFLSDPHWMIPTMALIGIWQLVGFNMILYLSGLSSIGKDIYDAATVDGIENPFDRFFKITWPLLGPTHLFVIVTSTITGFKVFDTVAVLTQGRNGSEVLLYDIYLEGFTFSKMGYASAVTLAFLGIVLFLSAWQATHLDKKVHYQ